MLVENFVHMSLLNMLIYIYVLCVPVAIYMYFNVLKYRSHLSCFEKTLKIVCFNMSDIYLTCLALIHDK